MSSREQEDKCPYSKVLSHKELFFHLVRMYGNMTFTLEYWIISVIQVN